MSGVFRNIDPPPPHRPASVSALTWEHVRNCLYFPILKGDGGSELSEHHGQRWGGRCRPLRPLQGLSNVRAVTTCLTIPSQFASLL